MPAPKEEDLRQQARVIFKGMVSRVNDSNVPEVAAGKDTVVVRVDQVLTAPEVMADLAGQEVTVKLAAKELIKAGERGVFYTNGMIWGEHIAVESVGHLPEEGAAVAMASRSMDAGQNLRDEEVRKRLQTSDSVIAGKVISVRLPQKPAAARAARRGARALAEDAAPTTTGEAISEHNPEWREALVEVHSVEKGQVRTKQTVIRFPASNDVRWHRAPKFHAGQEGMFILHKHTAATETIARRRGAGGGIPPGADAAMATAEEVESPDAFTALHPEDFQPLHRHAEIRTILKTQSPQS